jgi:MoaA/NifB/PqqE/SkfB family radical SAM enzyme
VKKMLKNLQVEVSTFCGMRCSFCPRNLFSFKWKQRNMDLSLYRRISKVFPSVEYVHLQGWGEPLQNPDLPEMIRIARENGCKVGLTTNGVLIDDKMAEFLLERMDRITFSLGGASKETHERIRVGSSYERLLSRIRMISKGRKGKKPIIAITFQLTRDNIEELSSVVKLAYELGVDEVIAPNVDYVPSREVEKMVVFSCPRMDKNFLRKIEEAEKTAGELGIVFGRRSLEMLEIPVCAEDPLESAFISVDGDVSPCVYLNLPTEGEKIERIFCGKEVRVNKVIFGNIAEKTFEDIWNSSGYREFRDHFHKRSIAWKGPVDIFNLSEEIPPLPEPCKTCYKAYSI